MHRIVYIFLLSLVSFTSSCQNKITGKTGAGNSASNNTRPIVFAGADKTVQLPTSSVTLTGTATDNQQVASVNWSKISGPTGGAISSPSTYTTSITGLVEGVYTYIFKATDNKGLFSTDTVQITVFKAANIAPVVSGGSGQILTLPTNSTSVTAVATDADGTISTYEWSQVSGPSTATIATPTTASTTISELVEGTYIFQILVTDNSGGTSSNTVTITVNPDVSNMAPVAIAGGNKVVQLPVSSTQLVGSGTDVDGTISSYSWAQTGGSSSIRVEVLSPTTINIHDLAVGTYEFTLTVTDNDGATATDKAVITVLRIPNNLPIAVAGELITIQLPLNEATLSGTGSSDIEGPIVSYSWSKLSGPSGGTIEFSTEPITRIYSLQEGTYKYQLIVTDSDGATDIDVVDVVVLPPVNAPPQARAGDDQFLVLPTISTIISASGSTDDVSISSYSWVKLSGPAGGNIVNPNSVSTTINTLQVGVYEYRVTVTDNRGLTDQDIVKITVTAAPPPNVAPVINAGDNQIVQLPVDEVTLNGTATDSDGSITSISWSKISGPAGTLFYSFQNALTTTIQPLLQGVYIFRLSVTDDDGAVSTDDIQVTVNRIPNQPPLVDAGANITVQLPNNSTTLQGSASDAEGAVTYLWTKVSGPIGGIIANSTNNVTLISNLVAGTYTYRLSGTDTDGVAVTDDVQVFVLPAPNQLPIVNAGVNKTIQLPVNSTTVTATASDPDGTIFSYSWTKLSGTGGVISSPSSATTNITGLTAGQYEFEILVVDNSGGMARDQIVITVLPATPSNIAPTAQAGPNIVLTLPTNSTTLSGSGSDVDGTIVGYLWTKITGPVTGTIVSSTSASTSLTNLVQGQYEFELTVTDNAGGTGKDRVLVTVNGAANQAPTVNAGTDIVITLPINSTNLNAVATDADGTITFYAWTMISGPANYVIVSPTSASTSITNLAQGTYQFQIKATDNSGAVAIDVVQVQVNAAVTDPANTGAYTFTVPVSSGSSTTTVSTGVYRDDTVLVRNLFIAEKMVPGQYTRFWDGRDNKGNLVSNLGRYSIKGITHNIKATWEGTFGNRSKFMTGDNRHKAYYRCAAGVVIVGPWIYYVTGYSEGAPSVAKAALNNIGVRVDIFKTNHTCDLNYITSDGNIVYIAGYDPNRLGNFVFGLNVSDDKETQFINGVYFDALTQKDYSKAIDVIMNRAGTNSTGLAVQKTGQYLINTRGGVNEITITNKTTGAFVANIKGYTNPRQVYCDPVTNAVWMTTGVDSVCKYTLAADGKSFSAPGPKLSGVIDPQAIAVNPAGNILAVANGGLSQQVKFYNPTTLTQTSTLGQLKGYNGSTLVENDKFYFTDVNGRNTGQYLMTSSLAFQSDNSLWVNDPGNLRVQHFTAGHVYVEQLAWNGQTYFTYVDKSDVKRIFVGMHLEYEIDYSKPLTDSTSWKLKRNHGWASNVVYYAGAPKYHRTFSNGKTFAYHRRTGARTPAFSWELIQITDTGYLYTGLTTVGLTQYLANDGSVQDFRPTGPKGFMTGVLKRYPQTGYTVQGYPTWSLTGETLATVQMMDTLIGNPYWYPNYQTYTEGSNKIFFFNGKGAADLPDPKGEMVTTVHQGDHVAIVSKGFNKGLEQVITERSTHRSYQGMYPPPTWFDQGNTVNDYAGGAGMVMDRFFTTSYHGEFWKQSQTNKYNMYWDNGLPLLQFGTTRPDVGFAFGSSAAEMAGNALSPTMFRWNTDKAYMYHGDESDHSGTHRWSIDGLSTVQEFTVNIGFPSAYVAPVKGYVDLMAGLPWNDTLKANVAGWTMNPVAPVLGNRYQNLWSVKTAAYTYDKLEPTDIYVDYMANFTTTRTVSRDLGLTDATSDWKITADVVMNGQANTNNIFGFFQVTDITGKILARFYQNQILANGVYTTNIYGNGKLIASGTREAMGALTRKPQPLEIIYNAGIMTFKYSNYPSITTTKLDATSDHTKPRNLQLHFGTIFWNGPLDGKSLGIIGARYYEDIL